MTITGSSAGRMPPPPPAPRSQAYHPLIQVTADGTSADVSDDIINGHDDDDDFEKILIPEPSPTSSSSSRFTKSDKEDFIHMIYNVDPVKSLAEEADEEEDSVSFLPSGDKKKKNKTRKKKKRQNDPMKQYLINEDGDEEEDLDLPHPSTVPSEETSLMICIQVFISLSGRRIRDCGCRTSTGLRAALAGLPGGFRGVHSWCQHCWD